MNLKDLKVKVTYEVGLGNLDIPKEALEQMEDAYENCKDLDGFGYDKYNEAREWLNSNIQESDCCDIEYEIIEMDFPSNAT